MDFDFDQIGSMLGNLSEEELQNLQETAQTLFASLGGGDPSGTPPPEDCEDSGFGGFDGISPELLAKLSLLMRQMHRHDPRTDLILALKPHLSRRRQQRAEQAVQMIKLLEMLPALQGALG
ncbi:MAG: IS110 family transposase [Oscillospiraceae bacterium]|jgi:hypothetical protein|nr:IS110 family transposase [Oscillospiraceae bacterium]